MLPEQYMTSGITETAVGAHWVQSTLDITWDGSIQIQADNNAPWKPFAPQEPITATAE